MKSEVRCAETGWSHRGPEGWVPGHLAPCPNRARYQARDPKSGGPMGDWTPLCGTHANTGRWSGYPGIEWRDLG